MLDIFFDILFVTHISLNKDLQIQKHEQEILPLVIPSLSSNETIY